VKISDLSSYLMNKELINFFTHLQSIVINAYMEILNITYNMILKN